MYWGYSYSLCFYSTCVIVYLHYERYIWTNAVPFDAIFPIPKPTLLRRKHTWTNSKKNIGRYYYKCANSVGLFVAHIHTLAHVHIHKTLYYLAVWWDFFGPQNNKKIHMYIKSKNWNITVLRWMLHINATKLTRRIGFTKLAENWNLNKCNIHLQFTVYNYLYNKNELSLYSLLSNRNSVMP